MSGTYFENMLLRNILVHISRHDISTKTLLQRLCRDWISALNVVYIGRDVSTISQAKSNNIHIKPRLFGWKQPQHLHDHELRMLKGLKVDILIIDDMYVDAWFTLFYRYMANDCIVVSKKQLTVHINERHDMFYEPSIDLNAFYVIGHYIKRNIFGLLSEYGVHKIKDIMKRGYTSLITKQEVIDMVAKRFANNHTMQEVLAIASDIVSHLYEFIIFVDKPFDDNEMSHYISMYEKNKVEAILTVECN